jgi:Zn-dependent protease with chaperone function
MNRPASLHIAILAALTAVMAVLPSCTTSKQGAYSRMTSRMAKAGPPGSYPIPVNSADFSGATVEAMRVAMPRNPGGDALRDQAIIDIAITDALAQFGFPGAVEFHSSSDLRRRWFILYYAAPARTLVFEQTRADVRLLATRQRYRSRLVVQMLAVPRSAEILGLGRPPMPAPWPKTVEPSLYNAFDVPIHPVAPPGLVAGSDFNAVAMSLRYLVPITSAGPAVRRANAAFAALVRVARIPGINWKLVVFNSSQPIGFSLDDGSVFVSTGLIEGLNETEETCAIAHLMGHVRYQHSKQAWRRHELWAAHQTAAAVPRSIAGVLTAPLGGFPPEPQAAARTSAPSGNQRLAESHFMEMLTNPMSGYTRSQENEANLAAAQYLLALHIEPDALFYTMLKLTNWPYHPEPGSIRFAQIHHLDLTIPDLGRMLDAGYFPEP